MDSSHTREDANAPSYDSSDEWEIGLGNLIIDLDADLEKDGHHHDGAAAAHLDTTSPMKIVGKMKIKRKVSSSATTPVAGKGEGASPITVRKDSNTSTGSSTPDGDPSSSSMYLASPDRSNCGEDVKSGQPAKSVANTLLVGQSGSISSGKREAMTTISGMKPVPNVAIKPIVTSATSATSANVLQLKTSPSVSILNPTPVVPAAQSALPRPSALHLPGEAVKQQQNKAPVAAAKSPAEEGEGEGEVAMKKARMEKEGSKSDPAAGKRSAAAEPSCSSGRKHSGKKAKVDKPVRHSVAVDTMDIGVATEPECIGPCEPGTSVNLEGIVWHETDQGVLVVNVTWRNKTYVGTLMDCTRHDWAAPRFCDSPTSDMESRGKGSGRPKRGRNSTSSGSDLSNYTETRSSIHSKLRNSTKGRRSSNASNGTRTPPCTLEKNAGKRKTKETDGEETVQTSKRQKTGVRPNSSASEGGRHLPVLIDCPEPNCNKKYKHKNGLHYHLSHAHHNNLDKDGNWRERTDDGDEDSKSNASDDVGVQTAQPMDNKKKVDKKDSSSKEEERMDVDKGEAKTAETLEEETASCLRASPEGSVDSNGDGSGQKKSDSVKSREGTKSPKAHKTHVDKFTAGMKCLGIPKPKEGKASPSKAPKNDASTDRTVKTPKKLPVASFDKDMSIFDFNAANDEQATAEGAVGASEKHFSVSVIRPNPETTGVKSEPVSPTPFAKAADHAKGPKQHSSNSTSSDPGVDDKNLKKTEKDKAKTDKHNKKAKHDKVLMKAGKTIRPIAPAPAPIASSTSAPPPQLIAIPTTLVQNPVAVTCALSVPGMTTVTAKPQGTLGTTTVNPSLKPIQPKPATISSIPSQDASSLNLMSFKDKDKKSKQKKKVKGDKDKLPASPSDGSKPAMKEQASDQRLKNPLLPSVPETNILKQALTASGIVEPDNSDKNKAVSAADVWKRDGNKSDMPMDRVTKVLPPSQQDTPASTAPLGNVTMPQIPKLIPTSSVTVPSSRPSKQLTLPPQHPQHSVPQGHLQSPSQLQQPHLHQPSLGAMTSGMKIAVSKSDACGQERASTNLSVHTTLAKDAPKNTQLLSPPSGNRTGNISPAYSDISEDGVDDQSKQAKSAEAFSFPRQDPRKPPSESLQRTSSEGSPGGEQMPLFLGTDRKGTPEGGIVGGSIVQGKPAIERGEEGKKGVGKEQSSQRPGTLNPTLHPSVPHVYSGSHYPYLHGYVNIDPAYHMRLMATDPQYRQKEERFLEDQRKRAEKLRGQESGDKQSESKPESSEKRRPIVNLQTEPITPPQAPRHLDGRDKSRDKDHITKSRHIDFQKKEGGSPSTAGRTPESEKQHSAILLAERQREEMRQYYLYQQKLMEQQRQVEEQRKNDQKDGVNLSKKDLPTPEQGDGKSRTPTPTPRNISTPTKDQSGRLSADLDNIDSKSPSGKGFKGSDGKTPEQRKLLEGYSYLQPPYPYGTIPYDPSHPTFQPMVYPAFLHPDLRFPPASSPVGPAWKSPSEKGRFEQEQGEQGSSSPHSLSSKSAGQKSPEAHDPPAHSLEVLQQHTKQYFSPSQKHGSSSRPRTPEKGRTTPGQRSRSSSPAARKTPEMSSTSSSNTASREDGRRPTVHQHMHTHQHTHVGVGVTYPVLPSYDPYVLASQQAAAAAAASASAAAVNQYSSVRREKS